MKAIRSFIITTILGGLIVLLPVGLLVFVLVWVYGFISDLIQPLANKVIESQEVSHHAANGISIVIIIAFCFVIGLVMRTRLGTFLFELIENKLLKIAPGYTLIKETVKQFLGNNPPPFQSVALCQLTESAARVTGFITQKHADGSYTIFVPTAPSPLSGNVYHIPESYVTHVDVTVESAMQTMISCGAGSDRLSNNKLDHPPNEKPPVTD